MKHLTDDEFLKLSRVEQIEYLERVKTDNLLNRKESVDLPPNNNYKYAVLAEYERMFDDKLDFLTEENRQIGLEILKDSEIQHMVKTTLSKYYTTGKIKKYLQKLNKSN